LRIQKIIKKKLNALKKGVSFNIMDGTGRLKRLRSFKPTSKKDLKRRFLMEKMN